VRSYGTIEYKEGRWIVRCEPHVMMMVKRLFPKVDKSSHGAMVLKDSLETCRDLSWLLLRYPMEGDHLLYLERRAENHRERVEQLEHILSADYQPPATYTMALPPRSYQGVAAQLGLARRRLLLGDDVGLGKTISALTMVADPRTLPTLVVTMTHLPMQWAREVKRFLPDLKVHIVKTGKPYALDNLRGLNGPPDVLIINYHKLNGWADMLAGWNKLIVFDEIQELRTGEGTEGPVLKYRAARHLARHSEFVLGLSATPIYNYGGEIWSVLDVIEEDGLGSRDEFNREWCESLGQGKYRVKQPKVLGAFLREQGLLLRRTRKDVGRELPGVHKIAYPIDADIRALDQVGASARELAQIILSQGAEKAAKFQAGGKFDMMVRQATGIAKAPYVAEFVRMLAEDDQVVLFGWHREVYKIWMDRLKDLNPVLYTGSESPKQKDEARGKFIAGEARVFIMSLRSGAGLDGLQQVSSTCVFGELDWSPMVHEQNEGRLARDGQDSAVWAYYPHCEEGSDPVMIDVLGVKRSQAEGVMDPEKEQLEVLPVDGGSHVKRLAEEYLRRKP